ncbi:MAG: phosphatidate cytidylyltransferase [Paracoccaceae bacterium]
MSEPARNWGDLKTRIITGLVLATVGALAVWAGELWFLLLTVLAVSAMIWELAHIVGADKGPVPILLGISGGISVCLMAWFLDANISWAVVLMIVTFAFTATRLKNSGTVYAMAILLTASLLITLRNEWGAIWLLWLVLVVIASDVAGYLAGRSIGGPKFWPSISPKKTWSGTAAGWVAAGIIGAFMAPKLDVGYSLIAVSIVLAFAGQMGDIVQSALKRQAGIKDSSNLLPGHGGVLDRLDAIIGASIGLLIIRLLTGFPS